MYLTVAEIAAEMHWAVRTAYVYVTTQMTYVQAIKGGTIRVSRAAFEAWKRESECRANSGDASEQTEARGGRTGRTSLAAESRRDARTSARQERGSKPANSKERIHVSQPRKKHHSTTPS